MDWIVYILKCGDGTFYTGITNNLEKRIIKHEQGIGARYVKGRGPYEIFYTEKNFTKSQALKREAEIKSFNRTKKIRLADNKPAGIY